MSVLPRIPLGRSLSSLPYKQGMYIGRFREYFYYINHDGRLFLDDTKHKNFTSSFKDVEFLNFFYRHLKENKTGRWTVEFPWMSRCGIERNYLHCDDRPIVFTRLTSTQDTFLIGESSLTYPFQPSCLWMGSNGRLYHEGELSSALLSDRLADKLFPHCSFDHSGALSHIRWLGHLHATYSPSSI